MRDQMILGQNAVYSMDSRETGLNNNVIVCGTTGCGKTMSVSEPLLLETYDKSLIATVTKRRLVHKYRAMFGERGYEVEDLNFINPEESTVSFDPMQYIRSDADITFLAQSIVNSNPEEGTGGDPYWDNAAVSLLSAEIAYVWARRGREGSFLEVLRVHDDMDIEEDDRSGGIKTGNDWRFRMAKSRMEENPRYRFAVSCWSSFAKLPPSTAKCVFGTLNTKIDGIFTPQLREMFEVDRRVDFRSLATRKTVLFVSSSAVNPAMHCFVNLFYAQAFKSLFEFSERLPGGKLPIPVHMLCDDFATGSRIRNFPEYISIFREKQISVTILIQSESQLAGMYGENDATTIINNCDTYLYMGGMDLETGQSISTRRNTTLDEVLYMPVGDEIIFRRGQYPVDTKRYDITGDPRYLEVTQAYEAAQ